MSIRPIIKIDEEKCDGCGLCVPACKEGALQIIDGKARLVSEVYCDGLGACLGECPRGAITIEEREAAQFDEGAVKRHLDGLRKSPAHQEHAAGHSCPGSAAQNLLTGRPDEAEAGRPAEDIPSRLANWPVQITLLPVDAPYFQGAKLLIAADCVPFAFADFHRRFLSGRVVMVGCPKLDDVDLYLHKLADICRRNDIASVEVVHMEVPCCFGLDRLAREAVAESGRNIPLSVTVIGVRGGVLKRESIAA